MQQSLNVTPESASDILQAQKVNPLSAIFAPKSVAVIGASEKADSVGRTLLWNLISHPFGGTVFPVNPKRHSVLGIKAYPTISDLPERVDLAVIATPAPTVPGIIRECVDSGVKGAIILSAGFKEAGAAGVLLEQQILSETDRSKIRIIGPNCLGVMNPRTGFNATFASTIARPGNVGFISQSGALCTAILDWSFRENVGFSAFVSIGSMLDVDWGDLIDYLGDDPDTHSIVIYMESIGNARSFLSAAREVALTKPIIVIKAGRTEAAAKAAASHTGTLAGSDAVLDAAFRRCGVLRVNSISDLFDMAEVLAKQPRPKGPRLTILTNAGGPGVLATDTLITSGGELAPISEETRASLNQILPEHWSHSNPIDILGDADPHRYSKALEIAAKDPNSDGLLVILTPQAMTDPAQTAEELKPYGQISGKPILASWMGGSDVADGEMILNRNHIPTYSYPDTAARVFSYMWKSSYNLSGIYETPVLGNSECGIENGCAVVAQIIDAAKQAGRTILTEIESKQILAAYGIPIVETRLATSERKAIQYAEEIGYPVVLKLFSHTITHKTDVGGVQLNLTDAESVQRAYKTIVESVTEKVGAEHFLGVTVQPMVKISGYELIIGSSIDTQFGPVLLFGAGGQLVEVFQDRAIALPPLNTTLARRMMEQTQIHKALKGVRGRNSVDLASLEQLMVQFSQLVVEQRWIKEIDINPLLAIPPYQNEPGRLIALDARVVLHPADVTEDHLPKLAIRPYPTQYVGQWTMKDGNSVTIRPIRPEDEPLMVQFHKTLSEESVYFRYFHLIKLQSRVAHERLTRICFIDYDREMALVTEYQNPETHTREILAVGRLSKLHGTNEAEFALLVSDRTQCKGLGTELLRRLLEVSRNEKLESISADILLDNHGMQRVCQKLGFIIESTPDPTVVKAYMNLEGL
ncbi:bifunctional acetate--CoA ligase family protein/GNAT family N-acetyltransferase [Aetokthonos hydrillicola Thurmond2011]|jgi:acetyltransferase|uniref:Bifunctional acetate--CoA ligase family protein/GNAT family N-acetyltransferase n=1 Tax=Aetokthonos hydrillicola Thurmond2011 TaxID=2712845 RepID=A0AAP5MC12_9CYAN|nr:bifunctional acetate--CoA ligase family protein/GNAT family N-acetyltransferase [Aetokthonos hydrillicola]MBO3462986.1 bifunctional acetate--CoA ligase family protein/GNAT family N-acetyltransferase [Aetokthonos hydrillicola CCALA 1050]MBW4586355.1 bifunctional acetate--CoA ligase family protein/GNAT family N-acetyltransferase [Aetokthonos hydrillicola CCALA 1050]MDR9897484.1 bifunctional acetate--CoA ligase family protein/GNAT family N-acetyltransferase [Aetokthonos hydrillicola Thurmond2011